MLTVHGLVLSPWRLILIVRFPEGTFKILSGNIAPLDLDTFAKEFEHGLH